MGRASRLKDDVELSFWRRSWPWLLWVLAMGLAAAGAVLSLFNRNWISGWEAVFYLLGINAYGATGALIVVRQRRNRIGWLFLAVALINGVQIFTMQYAIYGLLVQNGRLPGADFAAWLQNWISGLPFGFVSLFLLLYPDGRLPSWRWSPLLGLVVLSWSGLALGSMLMPGPVVLYPLASPPLRLAVQNPTAMPWLYEQVWHAVDFWTWSLASFLLGIAAPIYRYWRGNAITRLQLRWLIFLASLVPITFFLSALGQSLGLPLAFDQILLPPVFFVGFPLAVTVAILRYRLYDIDLIIRRTLVFAILTASLALIYLTTVIVLQSLLPPRSELATVFSTLAVAALFNPLRRHIQTGIDRRFYRHKYDAARTLAAFGVIVRDEVDLEVIVSRMVEVVDETVQPASLSLWLAPANTHE